MTAAHPGGGPTVLRTLLGSQLRRLREANGITREAAGYEIRGSDSKISRIELGRVSFKERDVADLLTLYGVTDAKEQEQLLALARQANEPSWWQRYSDLLPQWFETYVDREEAARRIRTCEVQFVPGLLQTEDYARAVIARGHPRAPRDDVERRVRLRMMRQRIFDRPDGPWLWAVVDEAALRRPIGGSEVTRAQLKHLMEMARHPHITLQVAPLQLGAHAAEAGAFTILRFPDADLPDVVYVEQLTTALYLESRADVDQYAMTMDRLCVGSAGPTDTIHLIEGLLRRT